VVRDDDASSAVASSASATRASPLSSARPAIAPLLRERTPSARYRRMGRLNAAPADYRAGRSDQPPPEATDTRADPCVG